MGEQYSLLYSLKWVVKWFVIAVVIGLVVLMIGGMIANLFEVNISEAQIHQAARHQVTVAFTLQSNYKMNLFAPFFKIPDLWHQLRNQTCHPFLGLRDSQNNCLQTCNQDFSKQVFWFYQNDKVPVTTTCHVEPGTYMFFYGLSCDEMNSSGCDQGDDAYSSYFTVREKEMSYGK